MVAAVRRLLQGAGAQSWAFYFVVLSALFYGVMPGTTAGLVGVLAAILATVRIELNEYRGRVERLEAHGGVSPGQAEAPISPASRASAGD